MKEKISRNKISSHYKSFFELENMALAENDRLMIDWGESLINELVNQEVERRIKERQLTNDEIKESALKLGHEWLMISGEIIAFIRGAEWYRSRLTPQVTPQDTPQVQKTEGGGE